MRRWRHHRQLAARRIRGVERLVIEGHPYVEALDGLAWAHGVMELSVPATAVERPPGRDGTVDAARPPWAESRCRSEAASDGGGVQRSAGLWKATVEALRPGHA